jgi:hypothetical protein
VPCGRRPGPRIIQWHSKSCVILWSLVPNKLSLPVVCLSSSQNHGCQSHCTPYDDALLLSACCRVSARMRFTCLPPLLQRARRAYRMLPLPRRFASPHYVCTARESLRRASCCSSHGIKSYLLLPPIILQLPPNMCFAMSLRVFMHMPRCQDGDCDEA